MKDTRSYSSRNVRKLSVQTGFTARADVPVSSQISEPTFARRTPDQLKKIVAAQTSLQWTKIIAFPQHRTHRKDRDHVAQERTDPNSK